MTKFLMPFAPSRDQDRCLNYGLHSLSSLSLCETEVLRHDDGQVDERDGIH